MKRIRNAIQLNMTVILTLAVTLSIFLLGLIANNTMNTNKRIYEFMYRNDTAHYQIRSEVLTIKHILMPADSLSKRNSARLDIQSDYGYTQVHRVDSVLGTHERRIRILEGNKIYIKRVKK